MSHRGTEDYFISTLLPKSFVGLKIMDVGTGFGMTGCNIRTLYGFERSNNVSDYEVHGIESHVPYVNYLLDLNIYDKINLINAVDFWPYPEKFFDICIAQQVLEHNNQRDAYQIIKNMEFYTKGLIIIATPSGKDKSSPGRHGNVKSGHRYFFTEGEFISLGYETAIIRDGSESSRIVDLFARLWYYIRDKGKLIAWKKNVSL